MPYRYNGKELEAMNGLNQMDYGARRRLSWAPIWTSVDPLAEKYYSMSPYAYCAGNPVRYIDVQGKWIQDSKGGHAYSNGNWSNNTSMGTRTIGNDLQLTPIGRTQFNAMQNAAYPVKFTLSPGDGGTRNAGYHYTLVDGKITSAEIIVYAGNAKSTLDKVNAVINNPNAVVKADAGADDKARVANPPKTMDEVIGQEAVHETTHLTRDNLSDNSSTDYNVREGEPNNAEINAVKQTPENRIEPIPTPVVGIKIEPTK